MAEFVLNVQDIDESGKQLDFPVRAPWLTSVLGDGTTGDTEVRPDPDAPEGELRLHVHKQGKDIVVHGRVRANLVTPCARCLNPAHVAVDTEVVSLLTARGADFRPEPDEVELTPEDLDREFYTGDRIVLDDVVREHLLLEVPIKPLCSEDCPGIPVPAEVAGPADLKKAEEHGVDPRLAPLLKLVGKLDPTEE